MISNIIFSKDRAMQLDLLLRSIDKYCPNLFGEIVVLYNYSSKPFFDGYQRLMERFPTVNFVQDSVRARIPGELTFESDFKNILHNTKFSNICMIVDDCLFYKDISQHTSKILETISHPEVISFLLAVGGNSTYSDILKYHYKQPVFEEHDGVLAWNWKTADFGEFRCPFMLVGNIHKKEDFLHYLAGIQFENVSTLEANLQETWQRYRHNEVPNICACLKEQSLVHSANNRVQTDFVNPSGAEHSYDPNLLNYFYLKGKVIDLEALDTSKIKGLHKEIEFVFKYA